MGPGIRYEYFKSNYPGYVPYETHIYGGTVFARYMVIKDLSEAIGLGLNFGIFGHAEYEILSLESRYFEIGAPPDAVGRFNLHSVLIGGGIFQPFGRRGRVSDHGPLEPERNGQFTIQQSHLPDRIQFLAIFYKLFNISRF